MYSRASRWDGIKRRTSRGRMRAGRRIGLWPSARQPPHRTITFQAGPSQDGKRSCDLLMILDNHTPGNSSVSVDDGEDAFPTPPKLKLHHTGLGVHADRDEPFGILNREMEGKWFGPLPLDDWKDICLPCGLSSSTPGSKAPIHPPSIDFSKLPASDGNSVSPTHFVITFHPLSAFTLNRMSLPLVRSNPASRRMPSYCPQEP